MLKKVIKFVNGTEIHCLPDDDFDSDEALEMARKVLMPILKENKIIILETPPMKHGFFYDMWIKSKSD